MLPEESALTLTGNLAAVMKTVGHRDVKTAMHYQHSELEVVRAALAYGAASETTEIRMHRKKVQHTRETATSASH